MKLFGKAFFALGLTLLFIGCSDETTVFQNDLEESLVIENTAALQAAIGYNTAGVLEIFNENNLTAKAEAPAGDYPLTVIASVSPPSYQAGDNFTASHVSVDGDYAYVTYNTVGEVYSGAIDVVDVSDPHNPQLTSRLFFMNADLNSITYDNGFVYAAGGLDAANSAIASSNAFVAKISVSGGSLSTDNILYGFQQGDNATDVIVEGSRILVSSGKEGSITAYNKTDLSILSETYVADARAMSATATGFAVLDAGNGVQMLDANLVSNGLIPISTNLGEASKKTLATQGDKIIVAEAAKGAGIYNAGNGQLIEYIDIPVRPEGAEAGDIVTNAVVANEQALFMANGGAGMSLSETDESGTEAVGILELSGSINYVASKGDYAFAASGSQGLQIIKLNRPEPSLANQCIDLPVFEGDSKFKVENGENVAYSGSKGFNTLEVKDASLLLCGTWTVVNNLKVREAGLFELFGTMSVGRFSKPKKVVVEQGSTLRLEGSLTIYGDLELKDGSVLEVFGSDSVIDVFGEVKIDNDATVNGTFRDVRNKF
ncbi:hypothetical protein [Robiginitalea sp. IMCC43444]|uniref:hypothetical protein n=1 Tax=Robiginitalea sp. IMCC43444 TaxID=3459121 RepID=UPI0040423944